MMANEVHFGNLFVAAPNANMKRFIIMSVVWHGIL